MFDDYSERLFAHYVNGRWRAPFGCDSVTITTPMGTVAGQIVPAGARDIERAMRALSTVDHTQRQHLADILRASIPHLAQAVAIQSATEPDKTQLELMVSALCDATPSTAAVCVMGPDSARLVELGRALGAGLRQGVIWCPPPTLAIFATAIAQLVARANVPPGGFSLLHANSATRHHAIRQKGLTVIDI